MATFEDTSLPVSRTATLCDSNENRPTLGKTLSDTPIYPVPSVDADIPVVYSPARKLVLLMVFCIAQFLDVFNNSALFSAIPVFSEDLDMTPSQSAWIISSTQLTFASFMLVVSTFSRTVSFMQALTFCLERPDI